MPAPAQERREFPRKDTGGHAEIVKITGGAGVPEEKATVLNCSRGGLLLRVKSPRRRMLRAAEPLLRKRDSLTAILRIPPAFQDIDVLGEVVRVDRAADDPDYLHVGLRFFWDAQRQSGRDDHFQALGDLLEPGRASKRLVAANGARPGSGSGRAEQGKSARLVRGSSARLDRPGERSERVRPPVTPPVAEDSDAVLRKMGARTLDDSAGVPAPAPTVILQPPAPPEPRRASSARLPSPVAPQPPGDPGDITSWARARIATGTTPAEGTRAPDLRRAERTASAPAVYTSLVGPELGLYARGSAQLSDGAAVIELPEHFARQAAPESWTVHLTPTAECRGLFLASRSACKLLVKELGGGRSQAAFDWLVLAARRA